MAYGLSDLDDSVIATLRNNHTGPILHGFHVWSDDVIHCAKPKAGDPLMCSHSHCVSAALALR